MHQALTLLAFLIFVVTPAFANAPTSFNEAKVVAKLKVFFDQANGPVGDLYCGCKWQWVGKSGGRVDPESCGYEVRKQPTRAARTEWEHIVPAWQFGHQRQCWQNGGRKNCVATDPVFRGMEADLYNLYPSVGEVNGDRANFNFGMVSGVSAQYGQCTTRIDFGARTAEPRNQVKGLVARTTFYMFDRYKLNMSRQQQQLLMAWSKQYPPSSWEVERSERISLIVGHSNKFVTGERTWSLGHKPVGEGLAAAVPELPGRQVAKSQQQMTNAGSVGGEVIGNRRSNVYHLPVGCPSYGQVSPKNQVAFESESDAINAGFRKAGNCN
ncbi:deoxyribonuclease-1 [Pseudomonas sp. BIGb0408]|uniref:Deoxyribonuclease-1 n=1 Tax=Phytopseudomonas flavescens TaxID=29435 RepID=A0A7Y9XJ01_9GAMM|nr:MULTISPECIES: endonuclease [Pseudomonas]MCW2293164.1 deoxyribonuclease-1 [Pseudomonas sp. BIGb0408]NYH72265.1 deoxyribonuclease-1 [Pseudomonas flavescens]